MSRSNNYHDANNYFKRLIRKYSIIPKRINDKHLITCKTPTVPVPCCVEMSPNIQRKSTYNTYLPIMPKVLERNDNLFRTRSCKGPKRLKKSII